MHKIFVFGTLKEGFPNYQTNKGIRFRNEFVTKENYSLYLIGDRHSPWLVFDSNSSSPVKGQVFEINDEALAAMDKLERIDKPDGYRKFDTTVICLESGDEFTVLAYGKPPEMLDKSAIKLKLSGEYNIEHAKLYRSRYS
ncbi:gamma-glutamylcyclotransferase [Vibrio amylolyticus]|uniref:gamma-glutamylcyclotransferase family protein n=1 Tax=Vibrio amylolyticus TaxID=2847292 RepID=UPI003550F6A4